MLRTLAAVCLLFSLTVVALPQSRRGGAWLGGRWEGTGYQMDTDSTWTMVLTARGGKFLIEYPSLDCGGEWRLLSIDSRRARFRERITRNREACADRGSVVVERLSGRQVAYRYSHRGASDVSASAILNRKK
jgi:hypothetical protein